jgi:hypothetical protein
MSMHATYNKVEAVQRFRRIVINRAASNRSSLIVLDLSVQLHVLSRMQVVEPSKYVVVLSCQEFNRAIVLSGSEVTRAFIGHD